MTVTSSWKHMPPPRRASSRSAVNASCLSGIGLFQNSTSPRKMSSMVR